MTKYRVRLSTGRVIGPFEKHQLIELKSKGHIKGNEEAQVFPTGNWVSISNFNLFDEPQELSSEEKSNLDFDEKTFVINIEKIRNKKNEDGLIKFNQEKNYPQELLTETIQLANELKTIEKKVDQKKELKLLELDLDDHIDVIQNNEKEMNEVVEVPTVEENDKTQVIKINHQLLIQESEETEKKIDEQIRKIKKQEHKKKSKTQNENSTTSPKKKSFFYFLGLILLSLAILFPDEEKKDVGFKHLEPVIEFPTPFDVADEKKSNDEFQKGQAFFTKGTYPDLVKAGEYFKKSYENNIENEEALSLMLRAYTEVLKSSSAREKDAQGIFDLVKSKKTSLIQNPNGVIGLNQFYNAINKPDAAVDVIEKFLKLRPKEITQDLFAIYLQSLISVGKIAKSRQFYDALLKATEKNRYTYHAIIKYLILNQEKERSLEYVTEAIERNPQIVDFYLLKAELFIEQKEVKKTAQLLQSAKKMGLESNKLLLAKYYELMGLISVLKGSSDDAADFFQKSLKITESDNLRSKLADLDTPSVGHKLAESMIRESKAIKHLKQAREFFDGKNYELALSSASKASDTFPGHIPSELFLSKVQLKLGLTQQAIKTLEELNKRYPENNEINFFLIEAYIETNKLLDAKNRLQVISGTDLSNGWEYSSLNAKFFLKKNDLPLAVSWLNNSISLNPLNDKDIFELAKIFLKIANFENTKILLLKCMDLDPLNADYRIAYSKLIYETQNDQAAIGYLLSLKEDFGEDAKILSEIAILYFRSGKVKDFLDYKKKLEKDHFTDKSLYEFLIKAALLDDRPKDVPPLVEKLIAIEPGDYEQMMTAGRVLFELGKLKEAAKWFLKVKEKLPSYPKVLYYMAKIDFLSGDSDSALKKLEEDMKFNGENDDDLVFIAQIYQTQGKNVEAENLFKKAQKLNPGSFDAIVGLADISTTLNNHELSLELYRKAIKIKDNEPILQKKIGDVYRQLGQGALAIEAYKLYLEMDPESPHKANLEAYINLMK
jgi:tetratricopeptide (TPR) repeat protein